MNRTKTTHIVCIIAGMVALGFLLGRGCARHEHLVLINRNLRSLTIIYMSWTNSGWDKKDFGMFVQVTNTFLFTNQIKVGSKTFECAIGEVEPDLPPGILALTRDGLTALFINASNGPVEVYPLRPIHATFSQNLRSNQ